MNIPFLSLFKKKAAPAPAAETPKPAPVEKPSSERLSKTVMPSARSSSASADHARGGNGALAPTHVATAPAPETRPTISFGGSGGGVATAPPPRTELPPAVALALEPKVERAISLELADVVAKMPEGLVRPLDEGDASRRILLKAAELERGMANGKPTVSIASVYQQVPEIFLRPIEPSETLQVQLPFQQVLEQFTKLQVRGDQQREQAVPQVETPFLRVTIEDNSRFGMPPMGPIETGELPSVRVEPATAETIAAAEPEPASSAIRIQVPGAAPAAGNGAKPIPFRISAPAAASPNGNGSAPAAPPASAPAPEPAPAPAAPESKAAPARIPFKLSPNGTDAPASEQVPASSGPSVPTSVAAPVEAAPARIPFKIAAPAEEPRSKGEPWLTKDNFDAAQAAAPGETATPATPAEPKEAMVRLPLKAVFQNLTPLQLTGDVSDVPRNANVELPFALIEPQLASGRVGVTPEQFAAALPEEYRELFNADGAGGVVVLPLHEVLKNLPATSLRMRDDQEEQEKGANFATPFSAKAEEDAKRFNVAPTPVAKPVIAAPAAPAVEPEPVAEAPTAAAPEPAAAPEQKDSPTAAAAEQQPVAKAEAAAEPSQPAGRTPLQEAFDTDEQLDAKAAVQHVNRLAGVKACSIIFADGLSLAGSLPEEYEADGLCAMAPSLLQRVENHMTETKLGGLRAMTLSCTKGAITFFMHNNLCLAALHEQEQLAADVRDRLALTVDELSAKYSNPA